MSDKINVMIVEDQAMPRQLFEVIIKAQPKFNLTVSIDNAAIADIQAGRTGPIPRQLQNKHYDGADAKVKGQHYLYPHDYPNHWVQQQYLPDDLVGKKYYEFGPNKLEQASKAYWDAVKK